MTGEDLRTDGRPLLGAFRGILMVSNSGTEGFYKERLKLIAEMCNLSDEEPSFLSSISDRTRNVRSRDEEGV
jgi:hypothetical protein